MHEDSLVTSMGKICEVSLCALVPVNPWRADFVCKKIVGANLIGIWIVCWVFAACFIYGLIERREVHRCAQRVGFLAAVWGETCMHYVCMFEARF